MSHQCKAKVWLHNDYFESLCKRKIKKGKYCYQHEWMDKS